jgi:hypothetical protein
MWLRWLIGRGKRSETDGQTDYHLCLCSVFPVRCWTKSQMTHELMWIQMRTAVVFSPFLVFSACRFSLFLVFSACRFLVFSCFLVFAIWAAGWSERSCVSRMTFWGADRIDLPVSRRAQRRERTSRSTVLSFYHFTHLIQVSCGARWYEVGRWED